jgi:hypothetical protein
MSWQKKAFSNPEHPRVGATAAVLQKNIIIFGGKKGGDVYNSLLMFQTGTLVRQNSYQSWTKVKLTLMTVNHF